MPRRNCFVKISGDLFLRDDVHEWISELAKEYFMVVCIGGGTQINQAFMRAGLPVGVHGPLGRETATPEERQLARNILEQNQARLQDVLAEKGIPASVVIPELDVATVTCPVNGDQYTLTAYLGFDILYVATTKDRLTAKQEYFADYPKIKVRGFPP